MKRAYGGGQLLGGLMRANDARFRPASAAPAPVTRKQYQILLHIVPNKTQEET